MREARQCISCSNRPSLTIIDSKVVSRKLLGPADLARAQTLGIYELMEVVMVSDNKDFVFATFEVMAPSLKSFNNSQGFLIVGFVPSLNGDHLSREKGY